MNWIASLVSTAMADGSTFMPPQGTKIAEQYDSLYSFIVIASTIACIILIGGMIYFAMKYKRKSSNDKTAYITHNHMLEFLWSFIPLVIFLVMFAWGWVVYHNMRKMPENARVICVDTVLPGMGDIGGKAEKLLDICMMVVFSGKERTKAQWEVLYKTAGLKIETVIPLNEHSNSCLVIGTKL